MKLMGRLLGVIFMGVWGIPVWFIGYLAGFAARPFVVGWRKGNAAVSPAWRWIDGKEPNHER